MSLTVAAMFITVHDPEVALVFYRDASDSKCALTSPPRVFAGSPLVLRARTWTSCSPSRTVAARQTR